MQEKKKRLFYLDFIRAIAAIIVVIYHFNCTLTTYNITGFNKIFYTHANGHWGRIGVTLFFIISGVALMYNYNKKVDNKTYLKKRIKNIYPMFWIAYIVAFLYNFSKSTGIVPEIPKHKFLLTLVGMDGYFLYRSPNFYILGEWFLGAIIMLYLLFPLFRYLIKKSKVTASILFILSAIANVYILQFNPFNMSANRNILVCIFSFLIGMYFIEYIKEIKWQYALIALILFVTSITVKIGLSQYLVSNFAGYMLFIVLIYVAKLVKINIVKETFRTIGNYSYAVFLTHHIIMMEIMQKFTGKILGTFETVCLLMLTLIVIAIITKILYNVERKITNWIEEKLKGEV